MSDARAMFWLAAFLSAAPPAGALDGPAMRSLASASSVPSLDATLERQSEQSGAAFTGGPGASPIRADFAAQKIPPKLDSSGAQPSSAAPAVPEKPDRSKEVPPPISDSERRNLKTIRAAGAVAAGAGLGLFAYAVAVGATGPIGWAAALVFFGGLGAYLAHRRLEGHNDFGPGPGA